MERLARDKHYSLLQKFVIMVVKSFIGLAPGVDLFKLFASMEQLFLRYVKKSG
jgi:hypothetical protein